MPTMDARKIDSTILSQRRAASACNACTEYLNGQCLDEAVAGRVLRDVQRVLLTRVLLTREPVHLVAAPGLDLATHGARVSNERTKKDLKRSLLNTMAQLQSHNRICTAKFVKPKLPSRYLLAG